MGEIRQISFLSRDLQATMRHFAAAFGIGPWFYEPSISFRHCLYRGRPIETTIGAALANSGAMQFEIIQQNDSTPSVYTEFLQQYQRHEQVQHLNICVDDVAASTAEAVGRGYEVVQEGSTGLGTFTYLSHPMMPDICLELSDLKGLKADIFERVRLAAIGWDGSDPIRRGFPV